MAEDPQANTPAQAHDAPPLMAGLSACIGDYDLILCDVWGVIHNGVRAFPAACAALGRARAAGCTVVLITNAPRPHTSILPQLDTLGVPRSSYDAVVTSGDVTRVLLMRRPGVRVYHLGPERDRATFDGLDVVLSPLENAELVVATGLFNDAKETPADYATSLAAMKARDLPLICANPDLVVERGHTMIYCAGSIARAYEALGGEVVYCGKPHRPIYETAVATAEGLRGRAVDKNRVLGIGDSLRTDIVGAHDAGFDSLFIASGIHARELRSVDGNEPDSAALAALFKGQAHPRGVMACLVW